MWRQLGGSFQRLGVLEGSKEIYAATSPWSDFLNIVEIDATSVERVTLDGQTERTVAGHYSLDGKSGANGGFQIEKYSDGHDREGVREIAYSFSKKRVRNPERGFSDVFVRGTMVLAFDFARWRPKVS